MPVVLFPYNISLVKGLIDSPGFLYYIPHEVLLGIQEFWVECIEGLFMCVGSSVCLFLKFRGGLIKSNNVVMMMFLLFLLIVFNKIH